VKTNGTTLGLQPVFSLSWCTPNKTN